MNLKTLISAVVVLSMAACNSSKDSETELKSDSTTTKINIKEETVNYSSDGINMIGYVAYGDDDKARPVVLVVPEWWGLNEYSRSRARQLAELGYLAMAVDMYGNGKTVDSKDSAQMLAMPFYQDAQMAKSRFLAAYYKVKSMPQADTNQIAAIGYCFGGAQVINMAKLGVNLKGVVSFHGNLVGVPANKDLLSAPILVCHGEADPFVPAEEVATFKKQMDSIGGVYTFKSYPEATHAFTNPNSTAVGKREQIPIAYNAAADSASWKDMKEFFGKIFK